MSFNFVQCVIAVERGEEHVFHAINGGADVQLLRRTGNMRVVQDDRANSGLDLIGKAGIVFQKAVKRALAAILEFQVKHVAVCHPPRPIHPQRAGGQFGREWLQCLHAAYPEGVKRSTRERARKRLE
ncbi:hypothetical protein [Alicyclobacillus fructus]|uniref:hypothetical protein n=1 Tax=Alicyclobacillus fructus TaxID=2816082 RepID=UPI001F3C729B|nr:hypothetical protein [Alicyclobacillus fructus]